MKSNTPLFDKYSAKVKRFNIPLPGFEYYHQPSTEERIDPKFIERVRIESKLRNWLVDEKTKSGSYLVTGYRGMGKSSFVGKVLYETSATESLPLLLVGYLLYALLLACGFYISFHIVSGRSVDGVQIIKLLAIIILINAICICCKKKIFVRFVHSVKFGIDIISHSLKHKDAGNVWRYLNQSYKDRKTIKTNLNYDALDNKDHSRLVIKINLGHEILHERDILSLISHNICKKYAAYRHSIIANWEHLSLKLFFVFVVTILVALGTKGIFYWEPTCAITFLLAKIRLSLSFFDPLLLLFYFTIAWLMVTGVYRLFSFSQKSIQSVIDSLNDRIEAAINEGYEVGSSLTGEAQTSFSSKWHREKTYPLANLRVIEQELITVLEKISNSLFAPRFVIVLDELDKIDPDTNYDENAESTDLTEFNASNSGFPGGVTTRQRKQNVLKLLANIKLFVSTAKAKFIFISGRELYDAYLADLSDREFAISSIFNGVIYVDSFCSSTENQRDITSNTEHYICRMLMPVGYRRKYYTRLYYSYLCDNSTSKSIPNLKINFKLYYYYLLERYGLKEGKEHIRKDDWYKVEKTLLLLFHFSVYLYHISNGSPKKIGLYFEKYVRKINLVSDEEITVLPEGKCNKYNYYLSFGYTDQRKIGFINYISYPIIQAIINNANQFSDKLLISASFLTDHIYKHHSSGFSWRNLEHTPELLEIYKIPELRNFINAIVSYLKQSHLKPISCGLYQFKFRKKISEEISIFSKFSEEIAALFNFSLDESLSVKRHYQERLRHYSEKEGNSEISNHVVAGVHHILADLYLSDEEYNNAIFEYQKSIHLISNESFEGKVFDDPHYASHILFLIRNMLKLGLAYEKRKTYNSAYVTYNELVGLLIGFRYIDEMELGLKYSIEKISEWPRHRALLYAGTSESREQNEWMSALEKHVRPLIKNGKGDNELYSVSGDDLIASFSHQMTTKKYPIISRLSLLEDLRLVYQALLAKLFVLEKIELGGITKANIKVIESEYIFLHLATNEKDKFIISVDFFRKLGDILYYKNGLVGKCIDSFFDGLFYWGYDINDEILDFCNERNRYEAKAVLSEFVKKVTNESVSARLAKHKATFRDVIAHLKEEMNPGVGKMDKERQTIADFMDYLVESIQYIYFPKMDVCNKHRSKMWKKSCPLPCYACSYYNRSLDLLLTNYLNPENEDIQKDGDVTRREGKDFHLNDATSRAVAIHDLLQDSSRITSFRANYLSLLASSLDAMGNVLFSCSCEEDRIMDGFLSAFLSDVEGIDKRIYKKLVSVNEYLNHATLSKLEKAILYYYDASECYKQADELKEAANCLKKILYLLVNYLVVGSGGTPIGWNLKKIKSTLLKKALIHLYSHYEFINITEIQRIKWIFSVQMYEDIPLHWLSIFPDIEEIMLIYYEMILRARSLNRLEAFSSIYNNMYSSTYRIESTIYERVLVIRFRAIMNYEILNDSLCHLGIDEFNFLDPQFGARFCAFLDKFLKDESLERLLAGKLKDWKVGNKANKLESEIIREKCELLEFLINDSVYCLTKILEIINPLVSTTLFSNSFIAEIYQWLFNWNQLLDSLYTLYRILDIPDECDKDQFHDTYRIIKNCSKLVALKERFACHPNKNCLSSTFFDSVLKNIGNANMYYTLNNYSAEMTIKRYRQAREMNSEGQAYKEMISKIHFLDDDLDNDTLQFNLAIERYKLNCGYVDRQIESFVKMFQNSTLYDVSKYGIDQTVHRSCVNRFPIDCKIAGRLK